MTAKTSSTTTELPPLPAGFSYRLDLSRAATPRLLRKRPVHRWFGFPHSYSPELVEAILDEWDLPAGDSILDPFVGAGTTLRVAMERGYSALGTDLSPLAVLVSRVKITPYEAAQLRAALSSLKQRWERRESYPSPSWEPSKRLRKAFSSGELAELTRLREVILELEEEPVRDFFLVALLSVVPGFSRAVADGGWLRWLKRPDQSGYIAPRVWEQASKMIEDVEEQKFPRPDGQWQARILDARHLDALRPLAFDSLITSPPYANRHDYSRVFHIELLTLGKSEDEIFTLRHRSLRSHVEAKPPGTQIPLARYRESALLTQCLNQLPENSDQRIKQMMRGYFEDLFLVLNSARGVLKPKAKLAFVVGNVRYAGVPFPVDEILIAIGEQIGYRFLDAWVIRLRGNSAQQMSRFGRLPSRETVVMLHLDC